MGRITLCIAPMYPPRLHIAHDLVEALETAHQHQHHPEKQRENPRYSYIGDCLVVEEVLEIYYVSYSRHATAFTMDCLYGKERYRELAEMDAEALPSGLGTYTPEAALVCIQRNPYNDAGEITSISIPLANYSLIKLIDRRRRED